MEVLILIAAVVVCLCMVLPIVALVRTSKIRGLELRLAGVEAALLRLMRQQTPPALTPETTASPATATPTVPAPLAPPAVVESAQPPALAPLPDWTRPSTGAEPAAHME